MKVYWSTLAVDNLKSIARYIAKDNPTATRKVADKLKRKAESAGRFPKRGRVVPEIGQEMVRELLEGNYRIIYRMNQDSVIILALFDGHQQLDDSPLHR